MRRDALFGDEYLITPRTCHSNYCPVCRAKNLRKLRAMLYRTMYGNRWRLITLTFPNHSKDPTQQLREIYKAFKNFILRLRRVNKKIKYIRVIELHKSGFPHIHLVVNKYVSLQFISEAWKQLGGGIVDIRSAAHCKICKKAAPCVHIKNKAIAGHKQAARYLTEEVEKKAQDPHRLGLVYWQSGCRTINLSRNLTLKKIKSDWCFERMYDNLSDAMTILQIQKFNLEPGTENTIGWTLEGDAILIGHGIKSPPGSDPNPSPRYLESIGERMQRNQDEKNWKFTPGANPESSKYPELKPYFFPEPQEKAAAIHNASLLVP